MYTCLNISYHYIDIDVLCSLDLNAVQVDGMACSLKTNKPAGQEIKSGSTCKYKLH